MKARHELLEGAIGVFPEEESAYKLVKNLSWILPTVIISGALLDILLVFFYMRIAHPWKYILINEEDDKEVNESATNYPPDNESFQKNQAEVTIDKILENVQKEILERRVLREQAHKAILHREEN